ncbi:MAG: gamma-glutamylcyclotransferase [Myxococcales bacterium]|nr:gamma-glutamylcyclotransferase [Myxococcales bacterium]
MSERVWYFAYGSNLDRDTFVGRRGMRPLEAVPAWLGGFDLVFDLPVGPGERGVANLHDAPEGRVHGVAWAIPVSQASHLDKTEGVHRGYYLRREVQVTAPDGRKIDAFTYQSSHGVSGRKPSRRYLGLLLRGARHHDLPREWIDTLRGIDLAVDERSAQVELPWGSH